MYVVCTFLFSKKIVANRYTDGETGLYFSFCTLFFLTALFICTKQFTLLKYTIQWFLINSQICTTITTI